VNRPPPPVQSVILYALDLTCPIIKIYIRILEQVLYDISTHLDRQVAHSKAAPRAGISFGILNVRCCAASPRRCYPDRTRSLKFVARVECRSVSRWRFGGISRIGTVSVALLWIWNIELVVSPKIASIVHLSTNRLVLDDSVWRTRGCRISTLVLRKQHP
jgi:hypothetical protein